MTLEYRSWGCQDSQKLQNNASSHYPATIFALCIYFLQYETPLFRIRVFRTTRLIHTPSLSWLQNLNFKFGALRHERRRILAFYTRTSCLKRKKPRRGKGGGRLVNFFYLDQEIQVRSKKSWFEQASIIKMHRS